LDFAITLLEEKPNESKNESIDVGQIESHQFTRKKPAYPLFSSVWQAYAADPAHQATRTLSDTA